MMKFEGGYTVETVFDGSKLGIEPYAVEVAPSGDLLVLDAVNSNIYRVSPPLSRCEWFSLSRCFSCWSTASLKPLFCLFHLVGILL